MEELEKKNVKELRDMAKEAGIAKASSMKKAELVAALADAAEAKAEAKAKAKKVDARLTAHRPTIEKMVRGENRTTCPLEVNGQLCGAEKSPDHLLCPGCNKKYGWAGRNVVSRAITRLKNRIEPEVFSRVVAMAKAALRADPELEDEPLAEVLREEADFSGLPKGGVIGAVKRARRELAEEAARAEKDARHKARWAAALEAVEMVFPEVTCVEPDASYFATHTVKYGDVIISGAMMKAACKKVWEKRYPDWKKEAFEAAKEAHRRNAAGGRIDLKHYEEVKVRGKVVSEAMMKAAGHALINESKKARARAALAKEDNATKKPLATLGEVLKEVLEE